MIKEWLRVRVPDFYNLPEAEKKAIADFCLLWALFEGRILKAAASVKGICKAVEAWDADGTLDLQEYGPDLAYFRGRYLSNGAPNDPFAQLHFKKGDLEELVAAALADPDSPATDQVKACLIIVFRYRANLFHGGKWQSELRDQSDEFNAANSLLIKVLDLHGRLAR